MKWLCPNPFGHGAHNYFSPKSNYRINPYENLGVYADPREVRADKRVTLLSFHQPLQGDESTPEPVLSTTGTATKLFNTAPVIGSDLQVGDFVRWRDQVAAKQKYGSHSATGHGCFKPNLRERTYGFDLNDLRIVGRRRKLSVLWQDGKQSKHFTTELKSIQPLDHLLFPGDIITAREATRIGRYVNRQRIESSFDEMITFEDPTAFIIPTRVGVVQSIESAQRIAQVRWYTKPRVEFDQSAQRSNPLSVLGELGSDVEEVSLFEIMTHDFFDVRRKDLVTVVPSTVDEEAELMFNRIPDADEFKGLPVVCRRFSAMSTEHVVETLLFFAKLRPDIRKLVHSATITSGHGFRSNDDIDWVGAVVDVRTDGMVVVKFMKGDITINKVISRDQIFMFLDTVRELEDYLSDPGSLLGDFSDAGEQSPIAEEVEYEGGRRLDSDGDDKGWETDDTKGTPTSLPDLEDTDAEIQSDPTDVMEVEEPIQKQIPQVNGSSSHEKSMQVDSTRLKYKASNT